MSGEVQLFRPEAVAAQRTQWLGPVLLAPSLSHRLFAAFAVGAAAAIVALFAFAEFTRTARVAGWLAPQEGLVRVLAPRPGVVTALHVAEGTPVRRGERLLTLSDELQSAALGATQAGVVRRLDERRESLSQERGRQQQLLAQQQDALARRIQALHDEEAQIGGEIELLRSRVSIAERAEALHAELKNQGFISEQRLQQARAEKIEQRARLGALERNRTTIARERLVLESERRDLPLKFQKELGALQRSILQIDQERAEIEARREIVVPSPQDGTVTAVLAVPGGHAGGALPLLSIVPANAELEAQLFSPSRAIGFVRPGQPVLLRYQAYPYQKFGHYEGVVTSVSRSPVSAGELPPQLASGSGGAAAAASAASGEPLYRITVALARQTVTAYGEALRLQPGMLLEADVKLEKRRLYEWVLDPLYTLSGRWR